MSNEEKPFQPFRYISIDIETTGLDERKCNIVEIAAVIDDLSLPDTQERKAFHAYVLPPHGGVYAGEPYALQMHPKIFKRIDARESPYIYLEPWEVADTFTKWLKSNGFAYTRRDRFNVVGKNFSAFDRKFLNHCINGWRDKIDPIMHYRSLDPGTLYFDPRIDKVLPDTTTCYLRAGMVQDVAHTATEDALGVIGLIRRYYGVDGPTLRTANFSA